jgi:Nucleoside-diphosphate-sugar epimerases
MSLEPLTDYSKFKADCEKILSMYSSDEFITTSIRPATVCGYSKRQRLDLVVNILTNHAYHNKKIKVLGGDQLRPNIHIHDMCMSYLKVLNSPKEKINNQAFNVGFENHSVSDLADLVKKNISDDIEIIKTATNDNRSYHVSSEKISNLLDFQPQKNIENAVIDLKKAFNENLLINTFDNEFYFNIKRMNNINLK